MIADKAKIPAKIISILLAQLLVLIISVPHEPLLESNRYLKNSLYIDGKLRVPIGRGIERMKSILMPDSSEEPVMWTGTSLYSIFGAILAKKNGAPGYRLWSEVDESGEEVAAKYGIVIFKNEPGANRTMISTSPSIYDAQEYALKYLRKFPFKTREELIGHLKDSLTKIERMLREFEQDSIGHYYSNNAKQSVESMIMALSRINESDFQRFRRLLNIPVIIGISEKADQRRGLTGYSGLTEVPIISYIDFETEVVDIRISKENAKELLGMLKEMNLQDKINIIIDKTLSTALRTEAIIAGSDTETRQQL